MIAAALALLLAATADPLEAAREAFARADYAAAEASAQAATTPPHAGAALYLVGLSRFREGRPAEALAALDQAGREPDAPASPTFRYNRAACLYQLGRFAEAESDFLAAAEDASLSTAALVNAGFAALDAGAPARAQALAGRARAGASGAGLELVAELEAHLAEGESAAAAYRRGLDAFDAGRFGEARAQFRSAARLEPANGPALIMSGASSLQLGERAEARAELRRALSLPLDEADARVARDYLELLARGLRAAGEGFRGSVHAGAGFDSNALQTSLADPGELTSATSAATPSAFVEANLSVAFRAPLGARLFGEAAYAFDQLAYFAAGATDRSLQQHALSAALELSLRDDLRLGIALAGQLAFNGLGDFRGLQVAGGAGGFFAFDESESTTARLDLFWTHKQGLSEFGYLGGDRLDASLTQELRLPWVTLDAGYQLRLEEIGTELQPSTVPPPQDACPGRCTQEFVVPFGYLGNSLWIAARAKPWARLDLAASAGLEWRDYLDDSYLRVTRPDGSTSAFDRQRRHDLRWFGSAAASLHLTPSLLLSLRYDLLLSRSNVESTAGEGQGGQGSCGPPSFGCHEFDAGNRSFDKHVLSLGTTLTW